MEDHNKAPSIQILVEVKLEVKEVKFHLEVNMEVRMVNIINMKFRLMEMDEETLKEEEVTGAMVEIIEGNNQTMI